MFRAVKRYLGFKIFLSYFVVILVGVVVLATAAELSVPSAFNRHMTTMMSSMMDSSPEMNMDLFANFRTAVTEALGIAASAATVVAIIVSLFVSRQVVAPVREMMFASQRIAEGHYDERVHIKGSVKKDELDELAQLAISFNRMASTLEKTETMRRQLIGDVAHELRTPLTTIQGYMEGLMDSVLPADEETYQAVHHEADRLKRLVNDLQELSRVESGAYELERHPISIASLVNEIYKRLEQQFAEKGVELEVVVHQNLPKVMGDEDRLSQVLLNLVGNALQYTPSGGSVTISAERKDSEIQITVSDTGIGISPEHLQNIFTRFYRVDKSRSRAGGGSGIGLTIAKHLVEAHGGEIWARSAGPGQGSSFIFTLPVAG